jgi:hypothetical protein
MHGLLTIGEMKRVWGPIPKRKRGNESFEAIEAQKIAVSLLYKKLRIPPKKHWWS